jgi:hypothetical protein
MQGGGDSLRVTTDIERINEMKSIIQVIERSKFAAGKYDLELCKQANLELAAFLEAGEKMARMLKYVNDMNKQKEIDLDDDWLWAQNSKTGKEILSALAEWEAANK